MRKLFRISLFVFTLILSRNLCAQVVWQELFNVPDKGVWANENGEVISDLTGIAWSIDYTGCVFSNESDYAKTVVTAGGRFEVVDSDGEVVWTSEIIDISAYDAINVSLDASETGSSSGEDKKYLKAYIVVNGGDEAAFLPVNEVIGNWGVVNLSHKRIVGETLQIVVKMNSSYANDKVIFDNVLVEAIDSSSFFPSSIKIITSPLFAFSEDITTIRAATLNINNSVMPDSTIQLKLEGTDIIVAQSSFNEGIYTWGIQSNNNGALNYVISETSGGLPSVDSTIQFFRKEDAKLIEDFEEEDIQGWDFTTDWEVSDIAPIAGISSVKHALKDITGKSVFTHQGNTFKLSEEEFLFSFKIRNGNWDPSSTNLFYLWLKTEVETSAENGYVIGVNASGSSDLVSLWKVHNGIPDQLIAETMFDWDENVTAQIDVMRSAKGDWIINASNFQTGQSFSANAVDDEFQVVDDISLVFEFTSTRAGELWFDDLIVIGQNAAPFISGAKTLSSGRFQVFFNEDVQLDIFTVSNLKLTSNDGTNFTIQSIENVSPNSVIINAAKANNPYLVVTAFNLTDLEGKKTTESVYEFENAIPANVSDVIINEIMADPNPPSGLPEAEYLEIYNRTNHYIQLENWLLFVRNTNFVLPNHLIAPNEYLIICDEQFETEFKNHGNVLVLKTFPALLNSGTTLKIFNSESQLIDSISYSDQWYFDRLKANGGFSLERIDFDRFCGQRGNWIASNDEKGGTPGKVNSVHRENIDVLAPQLLAIDIVSSTMLELIFDEPLDSTAARLINSFSVPGLSIIQLNYNPGDLFIRIELRNPIKINTEYQLTLMQMIDECGNTSVEVSLPFTLVTLAAGQVLINEVLFNPFTNGFDFVELYNNSGLTIDLADLKLATRNDSLQLNSINVVSSLHVPFPVGKFLAFSKDTLNIRENYHVPYPENLKQMSGFPAYNNDMGRVVLLDDSLNVIDEFAYNQNMHSKWLTAFDGISLERLSVDVETNDASNWQSASSLVGYATPGYENSQLKIESGQKLAVQLQHDVVSPNGDGYNDELVITFMLDQPGYLANVYIFDAVGRQVNRLTNNDLIGNKLEINYDLRKSDGTLLPMGAYVVLTELVHLDVKKKMFRKAFLITDRN